MSLVQAGCTLLCGRKGVTYAKAGRSAVDGRQERVALREMAAFAAPSAASRLTRPRRSLTVWANLSPTCLRPVPTRAATWGPTIPAQVSCSSRLATPAASLATRPPRWQARASRRKDEWRGARISQGHGGCGPFVTSRLVFWRCVGQGLFCVSHAYLRARRETLGIVTVAPRSRCI